VSEAILRKWASLLDALLEAHALDGAQLAAADLIDEAVPGGAATAVGSADLVRLVRSSAEIRANPYRAYVLGVLLVMGTWVTAWRRMAASENSRVSHVTVASERATESELVAACTDFADLTNDDDPEVRALTYLLIGAVASPAAEAVERLEGLLDQEQHALAHACIVQALVKALVRLPEGNRSEVAQRISERIDDGSALDRARVNVELKSVARPPEEKRQLVDLIGLGFSEDPNGPLHWPAESV
jgi:hypothetical protein